MPFLTRIVGQEAALEARPVSHPVGMLTRLLLEHIGRRLTRNLKLCVLYLLSFLDRTNIGNAKIDGLQKSLHNLTTGQYNACLSIFFVSYACFEPLTNVLLKRLKPSIFIPIIMFVSSNQL